MAFCANCGSEVQGKFCAKCGSAIAGAASGGANPGAGAPPPPYTQPQPGAYAPPPPSQASAGLEENVACALCYLLGVLSGILFLVLEPYNRNRNIRFHAFQSIFMWLATVVIWIGVMIITSVLSFLPFGIISLILWPAFSLGMLVLWVMLMYKAYNRERWVLPIIGPMAEKQA